MYRCTVHPHWRGEKSTDAQIDIRNTGSSPLAWGKVEKLIAEKEEERFIPTGVGNSLCMYVRGEDDAVHPHWRGEKLFAQHLTASSGGSSPLAWGKARRWQDIFGGGRFIPTGVGKSHTSPIKKRG